MKKIRWCLAAPGILALGSILASPVHAQYDVGSDFSSSPLESAEVVETEEYRGQRGLADMFLLPIPQLARTKNFGLPSAFSTPASRYRLWFRTFGHWCTIGKTGGSADLEYYSYGISVGVDRQIGRSVLLGVALGGNEISAESDKSSRLNRRKSDVSAAHGSVYFRTTWDRLFFDLEGGIGYNDQSWPDRTSLQWNVHAETGAWWGHGLGRIEPFLGLRHVSLDLDPGTETKTTFLGGFRYSWQTSGAFSVTKPRLYAGILQELGDKNLMNAGVFVDAPTVFAIPGNEIEGTRFFFGGGFTSCMGRSLDLYLRYTAEIASDQASHTAMLGMNWNF